MSVKVLIIVVCVVALLVSSVGSIASDNCTVWFNYSTQDSMCICSPSIAGYITCSQEKEESMLHLGMTIGYQKSDNSVALVADVPYIFPRSVVNHPRLQIVLEYPLIEQRKYLCSVLNRNVTVDEQHSEEHSGFCGRCKSNHGYGPAIYSFGLQCAKCNVALGLIKYIALQMLPITIFYFAVFIFKIDLTCPNMFHYIMFCNLITFIFRFSAGLCMSYLYASGDLLSFMMKLGLTLSGVWSLDFLRFVVKPFCFKKKLHDCMVPFFDFFPAVYLLFLTLIIAGLIKLHRYRLKPIVTIWSPFQKILVYCKLNHDPVEAVVHTYATFFFLYFAKTVSVFTLSIHTISAFSQKGTKQVERNTLFYDPTSTYFETGHITVMMVVFVIAAILILPALLLLTVFHTSLFQRFYQAKVGRGWQKILRIFVYTLENGYKDGSNGTRDYRFVCGGCFMLIVLFVAIILLMYRNVKYNNDLQWPIISFAVTVVAVMYGSFRPYKKRSSNNMAMLIYATLIVIVNLICFIEQRSAILYHHQRRFLLIIIMLIILIVNIIYTVYITHKIIIYFVTRERATKWANSVCKLCKCPCNRNQPEEESLLHNAGPPGHHYR